MTDVLSLENGSSYLVSACAGAGKTRLLVERAISLISGSQRPGIVVAITFTEAAADEVRRRVVAQTTGRDSLTTGLWVGTIHAFCLYLLRNIASTSAYPSVEDVLGETEERTLFDTCWWQWVRSGEVNSVETLISLGLGAEVLGELIWELYKKRGIPRQVTTVPPDLDGHIEHIRRCVVRLSDLSSHCIDTSDDAYQMIEMLKARFCRSDQEEDRTVLERRVLATSVTKRAGLKRNWDTKAWSYLKETILSLSDAVSTCQNVLGPYVAHLCSAVFAGYSAHFNQFKRTQGLASYDDLVDEVLRKLREDEAFLSAARAHVASLLVDEFQDVDPVQAEICMLLTSDGPVGQHWTEVSVVPGKLFAVGDQMQSIYRFRGADSQQYQEICSVLRRSCSAVSLKRNYRCPSVIVNWVNASFAAANEVPMTSTREGGEIWRLVTGAHRSAGEYRRAEAATIANFIIHLVEQGTITSFSDVAVLMPVTTDIDVYAEVLAERGIVARVQRSKGGNEHSLGALLRALLGWLSAPGELALLQRWLAATTSMGHSGGKACMRGLFAATPDECQRSLREMRRGYLLNSTAEFLADVICSLEGTDGDEAALEAFSAAVASRSGLIPDKLHAQHEKGECVLLSSIHHAKGLEFPVVILANMDSVRPRPERVYRGPDGTLEFNIKVGETVCGTSGLELLAERERKEEAREMARLLYVACTRAKDILAVCTGEEARGMLGSLALDAVPVFSASEAHCTDQPTHTIEQAMRWKWVGKETEGESLPARSYADTRLGDALHAALRVMPVDDYRQDIVEAVARAYCVPDDSLANLVKACISSTLWCRLRDSECVLREKPITATVDGSFYKGVPDLLFKEGDGWVVADYKTAPSARLSEYQEQMDGYVSALRASGLKVKEAGVLMVQTGDWIRMEGSVCT
ncbi:MAG: UvrD-helicase domain-containing protein [Bacillota bacterium]